MKLKLFQQFLYVHVYASLHFLLKCAICISASKLLSKLNIALQRCLHFLGGLKSISDYKYKPQLKRHSNNFTTEKHCVGLKGIGKRLQKKLQSSECQIFKAYLSREGIRLQMIGHENLCVDNTNKGVNFF